MKKGFSLIEIVMAIMIIAVVAMYLGTAIPAAFLISGETQEIAKATDIAQGYLENVKTEMSSLSTYNAVSAGTTPPVDITSDMTNDGYYTITTQVSLAGPDDDTDSLKQISVSITKTDDSASPITLNTIIARPAEAT